jgi:hypothetical protein
LLLFGHKKRKGVFGETQYFVETTRCAGLGKEIHLYTPQIEAIVLISQNFEQANLL